MSECILQAKGISKEFPGVKALQHVDFDLRKGEVHALVGENGAGKSTLIHVLGGIHKPNEGTVELKGRPVHLNGIHDANRHGISIVFQELSLSEHMSVAENIFCNRQPVGKMGIIRFPELYQKTAEMLALFDEKINPKEKVKNLSVAQKQIVEILKAISTNPDVLILDEPTSSLSQVDAEKLFQNIRKLKEKGMSFIYISHHLNEIFEIADRLTVLRDGRTIITGDVKDFTENDLVAHMVGRELRGEEIEHRDRSGAENVFTIEHLTNPAYFHDVSLSLKRGEIVCISGLVGAGRSEMVKSAVGLMPAESGGVTVEGTPHVFKKYEQAIDAGVVYLSENRKEEGIFLDMAVTENVIAPSLKAFSKGPFRFLNTPMIQKFAHKCKDEFHIVTPSVRQKARNLSGGNQQKVLLSMWVSKQPKVLVIDEPTKGVDIGARSEIYALLRRVADQGTAVLVISSDLLEVLNISDRVLVMKDGRIVGELQRDQVNQERILALELGLDKA